MNKLVIRVNFFLELLNLLGFKFGAAPFLCSMQVT